MLRRDISERSRGGMRSDSRRSSQNISTKRLLILVALSLTACKTTSPAFPPAADLAAVTEAKPKPSAAILTDPAASDRYSSAVEAWGDRVRAAGVRLCRFHRALGMRVKCG